MGIMMTRLVILQVLIQGQKMKADGSARLVSGEKDSGKGERLQQ
jgi:hypothetical protein